MWKKKLQISKTQPSPNIIPVHSVDTITKRKTQIIRGETGLRLLALRWWGNTSPADHVITPKNSQLPSTQTLACYRKKIRQMASISIRESIRWLPGEASEPTSTLVLTSPGKRFVDLRILHPTKDDATDEGMKPLFRAARSTKSRILIFHRHYPARATGLGDCRYIVVCCNAGPWPRHDAFAVEALDRLSNPRCSFCHRRRVYVAARQRQDARGGEYGEPRYRRTNRL